MVLILWKQAQTKDFLTEKPTMLQSVTQDLRLWAESLVQKREVSIEDINKPSGSLNGEELVDCLDIVSF
jgi:hypothetical protein